MMTVLKHLRAVVLLPLNVTVIIPGLLLYLSGAWPQLGSLVAGPRLLTTVLGGCLIALGLLLLIATNWLFATIGKGTLAPWNPTQNLVVQGVYRHVRNPMISGVLFILLGEVTLFWSPAILGWFLLFFTANGVYIPLAEEPGLQQRFGQSYRDYRANVPRWIPRLQPWSPQVSERQPGDS